MSKIEDGGPAFPVVGMSHVNGQAVTAVFNGGMSLRDYFAAKAMQALSGTDQGMREEPWRIAECAYRMADAMLSARTTGAAS